MNINRILRLLTAVVVILGLFALADAPVAAPKVDHQNGQKLLGEHIKSNGNHVIHKKGAYTTSVEVKDGKVAGVHVNHAKKGDIPVKQYKTNKDMSQADGHHFTPFLSSQNKNLGTIYIVHSQMTQYDVTPIH